MFWRELGGSGRGILGRYISEYTQWHDFYSLVGGTKSEKRGIKAVIEGRAPAVPLRSVGVPESGG